MRTKSPPLDHELFRRIYMSQKRGAKVRVVAIACLCLFAVVAYVIGIFTKVQVFGIIASIIMLLLTQVPYLAVELPTPVLFRKSLAFNIFFEVLSYTAIIYFVGGVHDSWLVLLYGSLIAYYGIISSKIGPWVLAAGCSVSFFLMVVLQHIGLLPVITPLRDGLPARPLPLINQIMITLCVAFLLFMVASISSRAAKLIHRTQRQLQKEKRVLEKRVKERTLELENHRLHLESLVAERTLDLTKANQQLRNEIAEREQAENKLKESEAQYRFLTENVGDVIWTMDLDLRYTYVNQAVEKLRGYTAEETLHQKVADILTPASWRSATETLNGALEEIEPLSREKRERKTMSIELELIHKDGSMVWAEMNMRFLFDADGNPSGLIGATRNITKRKKMEMALLESEERYNALFQRSLEAVLIHDFSGRFIDGNQTALDLLGYRKEEINQLTVETLVGADQADQVWKIIEEIQANGHQKALSEFHLTSKDGQDVIVESKGGLIYREGKPHAIQILIRDITQRVQAENEMKAREADYRDLIQNIRVGVVVHSQDGTILSINAEACRILGTTSEQVGGKTIFDLGWQFLGPDGAPMPLEQYPINQILAKGEAIEQFLVGQRTGDMFYWGLVNAYPVFDRNGDLEKVVITFADITENERVKAALKESEARYRLLAENVRDVIYTIDMNMCFTYITPSMRRLSGYAPEALLGKHIHWLLTPESKSPAKLEARLIKSRLEREALQPFDMPILEYQIRCKDGSRKWIEVQLSFFTNEQNRVIGIVGVTRDITERRNTIERLSDAYQELKRTQTQLVHSAKMASIGELAAGVAHELNQPLMVIRTTAQYMQRQHKQKAIPPGEWLDQIESIVKNTKRMMNIISHLRTFSHQSTGKFTEVRINQVIDDCFMMVKQQLTLGNIETRFSLQPDLPDVQGRPHQLEQVFLNLISNAQDAIMSKRETSKDDRNQGVAEIDYIEITTRRIDSENNRVEICFSDNGPGIPEKHRDNIFDPFFTTKEVGKGTGLGLSISYGIIKDHRGDIEVSPRAPYGATFTITLPAAPS